MSYLVDIMALAGIALIGFGTYLIYPPAAYIVTGAIITSLSILSAIRKGVKQ